MNYNDLEFKTLIQQTLIDDLRKKFPITLSQKSDTDWDRGVAFGHQDVINLLECVMDQQFNKNK